MNSTILLCKTQSPLFTFSTVMVRFELTNFTLFSLLPSFIWGSSSPSPLGSQPRKQRRGRECKGAMCHDKIRVRGEIRQNQAGCNGSWVRCCTERKPKGGGHRRVNKLEKSSNVRASNTVRGRKSIEKDQKSSIITNTSYSIFTE